MKRAATVHRLEDAQDQCPNCGVRFTDLTSLAHTDSGCFLGMLVGVIKARSTRQIASSEVAAFAEADCLWDRWGAPAADELERLLVADPAATQRSRSDADSPTAEVSDP